MFFNPRIQRKGCVVSSKRKTWVISVEMQPIPTYSNQEKAPGTPSGNNSETRTASPAPFAMHLASRPPQVKIRDLALRLVVLCLLPTSDNPQLRAFKKRKKKKPDKEKDMTPE
jgi:hypothetical protein